MGTIEDVMVDIAEEGTQGGRAISWQDDLKAIRTELERQRSDRNGRKIILAFWLIFSIGALVIVIAFSGQIVDAIAKRAERASIQVREEYLADMAKKARRERIRAFDPETADILDEADRLLEE